MDRTLMDNANIRKITIGDIKTGMTYQKGHKYGRDGDYLEITSIIRDENAYHLFGSVTYLVYAKKTDGEFEFLWKYFERQPVTVECEVNNKFIENGQNAKTH